MKKVQIIALVNLIIISTGCASPTSIPTSEVVLKSEVKWEHLNPARGDKAPKAGTLWGDRNRTDPTGYLLKPADGFRSPPHIHNVSYRGVVISGLLHNDDPNASDMWMPTGSFWTQPKGAVHITAAKGAAKGKEILAYIEIEEGPYLVHPPQEEFDSKEKPINIDNSNIVWFDPSKTIMMQSDSKKTSPTLSLLWGNPQRNELNGTFLRLPVGFEGRISSDSSTLRAVVIKGNPQYKIDGKPKIHTLEAGSYFGSKGKAQHQITSKTEETLLYIRTKGGYTITSN